METRCLHLREPVLTAGDFGLDNEQRFRRCTIVGERLLFLESVPKLTPLSFAELGRFILRENEYLAVPRPRTVGLVSLPLRHGGAISDLCCLCCCQYQAPA